MRWKKNRRKARGFRFSFSKVILLVTLVIIILSAFFITRFNIFTIHIVDVQMEKTDCVNAEQIRNTSKLLGQNFLYFLFINSSSVENDLKKTYFCIRSIQASSYFPDKVKLAVYGREPAAILKVLKDATESGILEKFVEASPSAGATESGPIFMDPRFRGDVNVENFVIDIEGVIYSNNIEQVSTPTIFLSGLNLSVGQIIKEDFIKNALNILAKLKTFAINVSEVKIISNKILLINGMSKIIFNLNDRVDIQIASLQLILNKAKIDDSSLEFIDLRFDKPIVRIAPKHN